jgi:hypothetical protein
LGCSKCINGNDGILVELFSSKFAFNNITMSGERMWFGDIQENVQNKDWSEFICINLSRAMKVKVTTKKKEPP